MTKARITTFVCATLFALTAVANADTETPAPASAPSETAAPAQALLSTESPSPIKNFFTDAEWYFSWGYSTETWAPSDIRISQSATAGGSNNYTIHNVSAHDEPGWKSGIFNKGPFVPQYNIRIGRFIDEERTWAVELSLDHAKYTARVPQTARVSGTIDGASVNAPITLNATNFRYNLHNGANYLMVNVVKRLPLYGKTNESYNLAALLKGGAGLVIPHSDNMLLDGNSNSEKNGPKEWGNFFGTKHGWWQFDGVTAGIEAGLRFVIAKPVYLELTDKVAYAYLYDVPVYQGTATQSLWMNEIILSMGFTYDGPKKSAAH